METVEYKPESLGIQTKKLEPISVSSKVTVETGISVLIPTYNPDIKDIRQILLALSEQTYQNFEVIIANDGRDFYEHIQDIVPFGSVPFFYKKNNPRLGLYSSIKENMKYCKYDKILVLEQDIVPLSKNYLENLIELSRTCPDGIVTSKLMIDVNTDYKKYVFYKRRISNLGMSDKTKNDFSLSNDLKEAEVTFTKADLQNKRVLEELFSNGSANNNTAQDIIFSTLIKRNRKLITSDATACQVGWSDPSTTTFFLKKEYLYGKSVFDAWRHSDKKNLKSTSYFKEKLARVLFVSVEAIAILLLAFEVLVGGVLQLPLFALIIGLGLFYPQAVLARIGFWGFWRKRGGRFAEIIKSSVYVVLLDAAYALGILRKLI